MHCWLKLMVVALAMCATTPHDALADEVAVEQLNQVLKRPMLLTSGEDSVAKRFSVVMWFRMKPANVWVIIERFDAHLAYVMLHDDGTPFYVHVNHSLARFMDAPKPGWFFEKTSLPTYHFTDGKRGGVPAFDLPPRIPGVAGIHLDFAQKLRAMAKFPELLTRSADGTQFKVGHASTKIRMVLDTPADPAAFPVERVEIISETEVIGFRVLTGDEVKPHWTRSDLDDIANALHDTEVVEDLKRNPRKLSGKCPIGEVRTVAWELPKRLKINVISDELPEEILHRTVVRAEAGMRAGSPELERFALEREVKVDDEPPLKVGYERDGEEVAVVVRSAEGHPVALIRPGWMFALDPERGWILCDTLYAVAGVNADKQRGWKVGRTIGNGGLSLQIDPLQATRKLLDAKWKFEAAQGQLSTSTIETSITLELNSNPEQFPVRHVRIQNGTSIEDQQIVTGTNFTPLWTKVDQDWLRTEFKPVEEEFNDDLHSAILGQLAEGQADTCRSRSKDFAERIAKRAIQVPEP